MSELKHYLDNMRENLKLDPSSRKEILYELYGHFEDRVEELKDAGFSEEEATKEAAQHFGSIKVVADELNQVHSSSNWAQAVVAALPHLLFALLFALRQWSNIIWLLAILGSIAIAVVYGWQRNKPAWFFPWLGYALAPLLVVGFILLIFLGRALSLLPTNNLVQGWWVWLAAIVYLPFILWLLISITVQTVKRDWLLGSLMALPLPAIGGWFLAVQQEEGVLGEDKQPLYNLEPRIAISFLILAGIVIIFIRLRQRYLKAGALLAAGFAILILIAYSSGGINLLSLTFLALVTLFLLFGPALLWHRMEHQETEAWDPLLLERISHK